MLIGESDSALSLSIETMRLGRQRVVSDGCILVAQSLRVAPVNNNISEGETQ